MKNLFYTIGVSLFIVSCNSNDKKETRIVAEKTNQHKNKTIEYNLGEEISSEGAGTTANYVDGKIKKCTTNIYGEMGQTEIIYIFKGDQINVSQENLIYSTEGDSINPQKWTSKKISYIMDPNGLLISSNADQEKIIDIFQNVKKTVPFEIKQ